MMIRQNKRTLTHACIRIVTCRQVMAHASVCVFAMAYLGDVVLLVSRKHAGRKLE